MTTPAPRPTTGRPPAEGRGGFTLIELLVVIAIVAILVSLLLPAVQQAREAARRAQCQNNLKQLALATTMFADDFGAYPPARLVERPDDSLPPDQTCGGDGPSWLVLILPYLDQQPARDLWDLTEPFAQTPQPARNLVLSTLLCPSRRSGSQAVIPDGQGPPRTLPCGCAFPGRKIAGGAVTDYAGNHGAPGSPGLPSDFYWGGNGTGTIISSRAVCEITRRPKDGLWKDKVPLAAVRDGLTNTFLVGERHILRGNLGDLEKDGSGFDGSRFYTSSRVGGPGVPLATSPGDEVFGSDLFAFGSEHAGIVQFALADGSVRPVATTIDTVTLGRACNRRDGEVLGEFGTW